MTDWVVSSLSEDQRQSTSRVINQRLLFDLTQAEPIYPDTYEFTAQAYELGVALYLDGEDPSALRTASERAFEALRAGPMAEDVASWPVHILNTACYGILADRTPDVARFLRGVKVDDVSSDANWGERVRSRVVGLWLLLLRKDGWSDLDAVQRAVLDLRTEQEAAEREFLFASSAPREQAWNLVAAYHLAKAAEVLAVFCSQGAVGGAYDIREQLQAQFDRSLIACDRAELVELHSLVRLLAATAEKIVSNSIWTVTRAVNSRVTKFVEKLAGRENPRPIFEMLPPQRITLREQGLLGSGHRAVLVSLPTSSGKTFIAQFRILQALNQFDVERGWVAYVAPTRALVN